MNPDRQVKNTAGTSFLVASGNYVAINEGYRTNSGLGNSDANTLVQSFQDTQGMFWADSQVQIRDILDGTTNQFMVTERAHRYRTAGCNNQGRSAIVYVTRATNQVQYPNRGDGDSLTTIGRGINVEAPDCSNDFLTNTSPSSQHKGGAQFAMADGSVRFVSENADLTTLRRVGQRQDGNVVGEF
ncbi:MAG: DUF1559 domain-containing protein [Planctomycetaceae bacterium]|nr:DUF1559 domain-containing protein [Planctomycetaceae bacterium]